MVLMLASAVMLCFTSCLNEAADPNSGEGQLPANVATLSEQVAAMKSSVAAIETLQVELSETAELQGAAAQLESCATAVKEHIASVEAGMSGVNAAIAAMKLQKEIANVTGALKVDAALLENAARIQAGILSVESGVAAWLGKDFKNYFGVSAEQARLSVMLSSAKSQTLTADALMSDVEAGLRVGDATEELKAMVETVGNNSQALTNLNNEFTTLSTEVETSYTNAIKSAGTDSKAALKKANTKAEVALKSASESLAELSARISACETQLADINSRLTQIEASVAELLSKIQSLTFMSDFSSDYATAYYEMDLNSKVSDLNKPYNGKCVRTPVSTIELNYMVRPAAAASAVSKEVVSVMGYYATKLQTKAVDPSMFFDFDVESVSVTNPERGVVTVRVNHNLDEAFYFKEKGAKCALSITSGQTDITSKFVELTPVDNSGKVYVQSVVPSKDVVEIKKGETMTLEATINPSNAANKAIYWASTDTKIVRIDETTGNLLAYGVGTADVQVISRGTDEWGLPVVGTCKVVVTEAVTLTGPAYVEVGKTADLTLDFPGEMLVESKVWWTSEEEKATVADGTVTGVADTYLPYNYDYGTITVYCMINGKITVTHDMKVVVPQPRQIKFNNYADDVHEVTMKLDHSISFAGTILPDTSADKFRFFYESNAGTLGWINSDTGVINENSSNLSPGTYYVYARVFEINKNHYYAPGNSLWREMIVKVEPYYVESITLPATMNLAPGATATLTPSFTSDVDGKQPTNTSLTWTSSNPSIVSVDSKTGEMTAGIEGTATITATTASGAAANSAILTAECVVTVKTPVAEIKIGDYYYSDGTWSTDKKADKTVIGIVFSTANAVASDPLLLRDYPKCSNGLVVSTKEYSEALGYISTYNTAKDVAAYGGDILNLDAINGFTNTSTLGDYSQAKGYEGTYKAYYAQLYRKDAYGVAYKHNSSVPTPSGASPWYVPSYKELTYLSANIDKVNSSLSGVGDTISKTGYWLSSFKRYGSLDEIDMPYLFDMSTGTWGAAMNGKYTTAAPVRVVLAF